MIKCVQETSTYLSYFFFFFVCLRRKRWKQKIHLCVGMYILVKIEKTNKKNITSEAEISAPHFLTKYYCIGPKMRNLINWIWIHDFCIIVYENEYSAIFPSRSLTKLIRFSSNAHIGFFLSF